MSELATYSVFSGNSRIASGPLTEVIPVLKARSGEETDAQIVIFEDRSGRAVDFDLRGTVEEAVARALPPPPRTGPGRPLLGVVSREVSLLPRHWEWLEEQPSGASAALRRLVDQARIQNPGVTAARLAVEAAGRFMTAMAGNLPGYEEASRALYARDRRLLEERMAEWPRDIREHVLRLLGGLV